MITLDEAINKLECYPVSPSTLPYSVSIVTVEDLNYALHYLKVLQKMQKAQPVTKGEWDELYNSPLTWDELRTMEGKPVWVEQMESGKAYGKWLLVQTPPCFGDVYMVSRYRERILLYEPEMGKTWQAYRKERS